MNILVTGGSASGKSLYAEGVAQSLGGQLIYIATMKPYDEDAYLRIAKHQKQREGKGFSTIECYGALQEVQLPANGTVLLECVGNLVSNGLFCENPPENPLETICKGLDYLCANCKNLVVVSNEVGTDGGVYESHMMQYLELIGGVNAYAGHRFDCVREVVCGIPIAVKGELL